MKNRCAKIPLLLSALLFLVATTLLAAPAFDVAAIAFAATMSVLTFDTEPPPEKRFELSAARSDSFAPNGSRNSTTMSTSCCSSPPWEKSEA